MFWSDNTRNGEFIIQVTTKSLLRIIAFLLAFVLVNLSFNTIAYAQETEKPLDNVLSNLDSIDSLIDVSLLGTLGGLSLASASLLISGRGHIEQQKIDEEIRLVNEQNEEIRKKLETNLIGIKIKIKYIQSGIQYLVKAFFLFIAELVILLVFFDSFYDKISFSVIQNEIIISVFEVLPFLIGLSFLIVGAEYIRRAYTK